MKKFEGYDLSMVQLFRLKTFEMELVSASKDQLKDMVLELVAQQMVKDKLLNKIL